MNTSDGTMDFEARLRLDNLERDLNKMQRLFNESMQSSQRETNKLQQSIDTLAKGALAFFTFSQAKAFVNQVIEVRSQFQQLEISFGTMLKSKEKANALMSQMTELAAKTPFSLQEVSEGAKRLLAFQVPAEEVTETLRRMGDVASGLGVPMGQLIHVYGQVKAQGRLLTNDLYQFMNAGIPIIAELSKVVGKSETEIKEMVSAGKIGFTEIQAVIKNMTNEGGLFYNLMAEQSKSLGGQISNLKDNFQQVLNEIGKASEGITSGAISAVSFLVENYQTLGKVIAGLIGTYGTYKTAIIVHNAIIALNTQLTNGWTVAQLAQYRGLLLLEKAQKLLNATMLANPYVLVATVIGGLIATMWILKDSTDANAEATERHNQLRKEQADLIDDEKNRINGLISTIQDETKSWDERNKAFLALKSSTGSVLDKYTSLNQVLREMSQVLKDLNGRYETMNENMSRDAIGKTQEAIKAKESQIDKLIKMQAYDSRFAMSTQREINRLIKEVERDKLVLQKQQNVVVGIDVSQFANSLNGKSKAELDKIRKQIDDAYNSKKSPSTGSNFKITDDIQNPFLKYDFNELGRFNQAYKEHIKMIEQAKKQTTDFVAKKNEILVLQKQINEAEARNKKGTNISTEELNKLDEKRAKLKTLLEEYKKGTGDDLSAKSNTPKRTTKKETLPDFDTEKAQRDHNRQIQDDLFAREESRIKIMKDGAEKRLAIIQLEYDKQEEEIRRRSEDQLNAFIETEKQKAEAQGKWKKGQAFDTNTPAINAEKARLAESEKTLLADNAEYQRIQQEQVYKDLLEKYQTYTDQRKAIEEKYNADITALQAKLGADAPQVKKAQDEKARELKKLDILYKKEGTAIAKLFENMRKKTIKEIRQTIAEAEAEIDRLASNLDMGDKDNVEYIQSLRQQLEQTRETAERSDTVFGKLGTNIKNLFKAKPNTAEWQEAFNGMLSSAQSITGQFGQLGQEFERLGQSTGNSSLEKLGRTLQNTANLLNKTLSFAQMGASVGGGWGALIGAVVGLGVGGLEGAAKERLAHEKKLQEIAQSKINQQNEYNRLLWEEKMLHKENTSIFGTEDINNALSDLKEYNILWNDLERRMGFNLKKRYEDAGTSFRSYGYRSPNREGDDYLGLENIKIATGSYTTGAWFWKKSHTEYNSLLSVYPQLIDKAGEFDVNLAKSIVNNKEFEGTGKQALQTIIQQYEQALEAQKKFDEYLNKTFGEMGTSIIDSVVDSLKKGEDAFENFSKSVGNIISKLGKQLMYELFVAKDFKEFQKKMHKVAGDGNVNSEEYANATANLIAEFSSRMKGKIGEMQQFLKNWNEMSSNLGYDFLNEQRQAVEKGFARMSQDTAEELSGQFRLMTELQKQTKDGVVQISERTRFLSEDLKNLHAMSAQQLKHLAGIEVNTFQLHDMRKDLTGVKTILSDMQTRGIKMR
jgi:tape measure domain-containing protein